MKLPVYELKISENLNDDSEVSYVALVDAPAIQKDFLVFKEEFINPSKGEHKDEFLPRCIKYVIDEGKSSEQAVAICNSLWDEHFAGVKVSIDYDDTLSTDRGKTLAKRLISNGDVVYIISARQDKEGMLSVANELGIPESRVYATGSNKAKIEKIKELGISKHHDNNPDVVKELGSVGVKFGGPGSGRHPEDEGNSNNISVDVKTENTGEGEFKYYVTDKNGNEIGKLDVSEVDNKVIIDNIFVDENSQKQGIASQMVDNVLKNYKGDYYSYYDSNDNLIKQPYQIEIGMTVSDAGQKLYNKIKPKIDDFNNSQMNLKLSKHSFQIVSEDEHIISGPLMVANMPIYRNNEKMGEHYVTFSAETIKQIAIKFAKKKYQNHVNLMHDPNMAIEDCTMFESFIVDKKRGIMPMQGFEDIADGSWFGSFYVENPEVWKNIKDGFLKGFSVEGMFDYDNPTKSLSAEEQALKKISELLNVII